jgi:hypothetical protein
MYQIIGHYISGNRALVSLKKFLSKLTIQSTGGWILDSLFWVQNKIFLKE